MQKTQSLTCPTTHADVSTSHSSILSQYSQPFMSLAAPKANPIFHAANKNLFTKTHFNFRHLVTLYGWPAKQTIPLSVLARNQTKDFWTWNLAVSGSGKGTRMRVGWTKELRGSWRRDSRENWRGTTDRGSQHRTPETVAEKRGSSHGEEDQLKMSAFQ